MQAVIDRAALLSDIYKRNHARLSNAQPPLDIERELSWAILAEFNRQFYDAFAQLEANHARDHDRIANEVLAEIAAVLNVPVALAKKGAGLHYLWNAETKRRWHVFLRHVFAGSPPRTAADREQDVKRRAAFRRKVREHGDQMPAVPPGGEVIAFRPRPSVDD